MNRRWYTIVALMLTQPAFAQEPVPAPIATGMPVAPISHGDGLTPIQNAWDQDDGSGRGSGFLTGDKGFPNFIGYISNPTKAIDPRSLTQIIPIYDYASVSAIQRTTRGI